MKSEDIKKLRDLVETACKQKTNMYGYGIWTYHMVAVIENSKKLAEKLGADKEIVEIAAILHDYAAVSNKDFAKEHHLKGMEMSEQVLKRYHYPKDRIELVKECIYSHRGSTDIEPKTMEAKILASADAMAHFDNVDSLFYTVYEEQKMEIDEGTKWILGKLERSWKKLMPEAQEIMKDKYEAIKIALS